MAKSPLAFSFIAMMIDLGTLVILLLYKAQSQHTTKLFKYQTWFSAVLSFNRFECEKRKKLQKKKMI